MSESVPYAELSRKLYGQLVRRSDGNWEAIERVDGLADPQWLHVHTREGHEFWCQKDQNGRYYEA